MAATTLLLSTGDQRVVDGSLAEVVKELEDAARSSVGTLARLTQAETGEPIAISPTQVVAAHPGDPA
jgi:hypothetical protein